MKCYLSFVQRRKSSLLICSIVLIGLQPIFEASAVPARVRVIKKIACIPTGADCSAVASDAYRGMKTGFKTATQLPGFCYQITISNATDFTVFGIQVTDDHLDLSGCNFPTSLPAHGIATCYLAAEHDASVTNIVTAIGTREGTTAPTTNSASAIANVVPAGIACTKIVTSPDDLDGTPNNSHVTLPSDGASHAVTFKVIVRNTGSADLRAVRINDPLLVARGCPAPLSFVLLAGATTNVTLCTLQLACDELPFDNTVTVTGKIKPDSGECGTDINGDIITVRSTCSASVDCEGQCPPCVNPALGLAAASGCTVLELGGGKVDITGPAGGVLGDICIGPNGKLQMSGSQYVTGKIRLAAGATFSSSSSGSIGPVLTNVDLTTEIADALAASSNAASQACTQTFTSLQNTMTINGNGSLNVICVDDIVLNGKVLTLNGSASDKFIINVTGKLVLTGTSRIQVAGGALSQNVLYNMISDGDDVVAFSGGGGGTGCCNSSVDGTILAPDRKIQLSPGLVNGEIISGKDISIVSGSSVRCPACP